jgi:ABC-type taurine transport system ATPase subunit
MRAQLRGAALGALRGADLDLAPGRYVVLASEREPLSALVSVLAGREPPRHGRAWLDGIAAYGAPATRSKVAALFPEEALPPAKTVKDSVAKALSARGSTEPVRSLLGDADLSGLAVLSPASLGQRELRSIALALALAHDTAELVVVHEPLTTLVPGAWVLARLDAHTARGAIVLGTTTSAADATLLGGRWLCVELGRLRESEQVAARLGAGPWQQVLVESKDARALAQLLLDSPHGLSTDVGVATDSLKVMGPALDVTVQELIRVARQNDLEIRRIEAAVPPVEALLAARAGFARGAYEASRKAFATTPALGSGPPPDAAEPP